MALPTPGEHHELATAMPAPAPSTSTALPLHEVECSVYGWLETSGARCASVRDLLHELCTRLANTGIPLARASIVLRTLHPEILASAYIWQAESQEVQLLERGHDSLRTAAYLESPVKSIVDGSPGIRRRLADPACPRDYSILEDLAEQGITDYLVLPIVFGDGSHYAASWATKAPGGFSDPQLARLAALMPVYSLVLEVLARRRIAHDLMQVYLGRASAERVLQGAVQRGSNETIDAAIWFSDLRGFTALADRLPADTLLDLLNDYFEHVVMPIQGHGGDVLKFIGDGVLAIFPIDSFGSAAGACQAALKALKAAREATHARNQERLIGGLPEIKFGVGLHRGRLSYGNIGAPNRLDFTVIGPAVNHAVRIENMCRVMDRELLVSAAFAESWPKGFESLGFHALRGVREPQELFTPKS